MYPDTVTYDDTTFYKISDEVWENAPYAIRVQVGRTLSDGEDRQLAGLVGYAYAKTGGERGNSFTKDTPNSIIYWADTTKGRAYKHLDEFFEDARTYIVEGSPKRKRSGDTRLIEGLGDVGDISFWADNVVSYCDRPQCGQVTAPCEECETTHCYTHPHADKPDPRLPVLNDKGAINPGIYTVDTAQYRVGKTGRLTQFRDREWRSVNAGQKQDAEYRIKTRGTRTSVETLRSLGTASGTCLVCGKPLKDDASKNRGMGPKCAKDNGVT